MLSSAKLLIIDRSEHKTVNDIKQRKTFIIEGDSDQLDRIISLFETEELNQLLGIDVLDAGAIVSPLSLPIAIQPIDLMIVDKLADRWQNLLKNLLQQGYQPAYRSHEHSLTKRVILGDHSLELLLQLDALDPHQIQLFIQIRPPHGQGYLPSGLNVCLMDESDTILVSQTANSHTNILDLTQGNKLICEWTDRLIIGFKLGTESVRAYFPE
jgi:hypothetical protein